MEVNQIFTKNNMKPPKDLLLIWRQVDFDYLNTLKDQRYWFNNDLIITHLFNALQATFPEGERIFIEAARDGIQILRSKKNLDKTLENDYKIFVKQEASHGIHHKKWTDSLIKIGYKNMEFYNNQIRQIRVWFRKNIPTTIRLGISAAAEHYTATLAYFVSTLIPHFLDNSLPPFRALLLYHAMEEVEHKSVCFDIYQKISGSYIGKIFGLLFATFDVIINTFIRFRYLIQKDGLWNKQVFNLNPIKSRTYKDFLNINRKIFRGINRIFKFVNPRFHPWQTDERVKINNLFKDLQDRFKITPFVFKK